MDDSGSHRQSQRLLSRNVGVGAIACMLGAAQGVYAQQRRVVSDPPTCTSCLSFQRVASLGSLTDAELLQDLPSVQRDAKGRYLASGALPRTRLLVYDSAGKYAEALGRAGSGPGEFRSVAKLIRGPGDSLLVVDYGLNRVSVLDRGGQYARSFVLPFAPLDIEVVAPDKWIVAGMHFSPERAGYPLHRLNADGAILQSFGGEVAVVERRPSMTQRGTARDRDGVWAVRPDRYEVEYWDANGRLHTTLDRLTEWFPDRDIEGSRTTWREPIYPRIRDIHVDSAGLLWVMGGVAKRDWRPLPVNWNRPAADRGLDYDTIIEVIDPASGKLLASERLPWYGTSFTGDGLVVSHRADDDGVLVVDLWRGAFTRNPRGGK